MIIQSCSLYLMILFGNSYETSHEFWELNCLHYCRSRWHASSYQIINVWMSTHVSHLTVLCFFALLIVLDCVVFSHDNCLIVSACRIPITKGKLNMGTWQVFNFSIWHYALLLSHGFPCFFSFMVVTWLRWIDCKWILFLSIVPLFSMYILHCSR